MIEAEEVKFLEIVHQPQQRGMRFRYACEGKAAGSILAENSDMDKKSWPSCMVKIIFEKKNFFYSLLASIAKIVCTNCYNCRMFLFCRDAKKPGILEEKDIF